MSDRFSARAKRQRRRSWLRNLVYVLAVVLVGLIVWMVWFSPVLDVRSVNAEPTASLSAAQIRVAADVPLGTPMARVDTGQIRRRVEELKPVASVSVSRSWPHTITIRVTERKPVAWTKVKGQPWAVDASGVVFRQLGDTNGLVEITAGDQASLVAAAAIVHAVSTDAKIGPQLASVSAPTQDSVQLELTDGKQVVWGSAEDSAQKLTVLRDLLQVQARTYDVSAPQMPTTK